MVPADRPGDERAHEPAGEEPDARFTFANERTFLARNRTSLALIAGGLAVAELVDFETDGLQLVIAVPLLLLAAALSWSSFGRWQASERALRLREPLPPSRMPRMLAVAVGVLAVVAAAVAVVDALAS